MNKYEAWIENYRRRVGNTAGLCFSSTEEMCAQFPELQRQKGFVRLSNGDHWTHWWCTAPIGLMDRDPIIFDPSGNQWSPLYIMTYELYSESLHGHLSPALWHENVQTRP